MFPFNHSHITDDFNYYFGKQWRFESFSPARTDNLEELMYRHIRSYSHAFGDDSIERTDLYEMRDNTKVLRLWLSVPTFDSDDRVSNSWRCLYLFAGKKWAGADGIYAAGGYQLAFAARVQGLAAFPGELEKLALAPSMCTHKPEEIFQYQEKDSKTIWKCLVDKDLSFITILGLNAESGNMPEGSLKIPDTIDSLPVEKMDSHTFDKENHIQEITLPAHLYKEGLSGSVFNNCQDLKNIWISPKNKYYFSQDGVLYGMGEATKDLIRYPPGRQARSYRIMDGTGRIESYGFSQCRHLQEIHIPDSVTSICFEAFNRCDSLTELTLPPQLHDLDYYVFSGCANLRTVHLPDSLTSMRRAFIDCPSLTSIRLPDQLSLYGFKDAFKRCGSLKSIIVSENSKNFSSRDGVLCSKDGTTALWYPPGPPAYGGH